MGIFTKYCEICGKRIEKGKDIVRFGKHFDSEEHAEQYVEVMEAKKQMAPEEQDDSCGCC